MKNSSRFLSPTIVFEGENTLNILPQEIMSRFDYKKVLITTDKGIRKAGIVDKVEAVLNNAGIELVIYDNTQENPDIKQVEECTEIAKKEGITLIIGVGGGSSIDIGKAVGILMSNAGSLREYEGAEKQEFPPGAPLIAIPTTAGTGSEVTASTVISDVENNRKLSIRSIMNIPKMAFLDTTLLTSLPPHIIAATGIDALTHGIESYTSLDASPISDAYALASIKLIAENMRNFYFNPSDCVAARNMQIASLMAGQAFANAKLGTVHSLATPVGGVFHVAHGVANAILLVPVMEYNLPACINKYADIATAFGENISGMSKVKAAELGIEAVRRLKDDVAIPTTLTEVGVDPMYIDEMAEDSLTSGIHITNPRKTSLQDMKYIYHKSC